MKTPSKSTTLILMLTLTLFSCERPSEQENTKSVDAMAATNTPEIHAKWPMPETMMVHMRSLEQDVRALESSAEKDHAALAGKIDEHTQQLISSCTMDGEAHDALHHWLMPFLQLNKDYSGASDPAARSAKFKEIQDALAVFHERFE